MMKKNTATEYIVYYRLLKRTGQPCGAKLDQVTNGLGEWVDIACCDDFRIYLKLALYNFFFKSSELPSAE